MLPAGLSFDQAPPISVPFRFFLTAPLFLLAAAVLLFVEGPDMLASRYVPATLAATHLITLGFSTMVMSGALMQMLPVVAGSPVPRPNAVAGITHIALTVGALLLASAFLLNSNALTHAAAGLLAAGAVVFLVAAAFSLARASAQSPSVPAMRYAVLALLVTVLLGVTLALARYASAYPAYGRLAALHPLWGLFGWTSLLVMGVAYQVVPMFQITPNYPRALTSWLAGILFAMLWLRTLAEFLPEAAGIRLSYFSGLALMAGAALFAVTTLRLQRQRKRKISDTTLLFWRIGMGQLLLCAALWSALPVLPPDGEETARLLLGIAALPGFILAVINGMLYKIVPFLAWFHLQSRYAGKGLVPNMKQLQPDKAARGQMWLYFAAWLTLMGAVWLPWLTRPSAALWAANALWLGWNLMRATAMYRKTARLAQAGNSL